MSPREGVLAAQGLGLETVFPCHYIDPEDEDVLAFDPAWPTRGRVARPCRARS